MDNIVNIETLIELAFVFLHILYIYTGKQRGEFMLVHMFFSSHRQILLEKKYPFGPQGNFSVLHKFNQPLFLR